MSRRPRSGVERNMRLQLVLAVLGSLVAGVTSVDQPTPDASARSRSEVLSKGWLPYAQSLVAREQAVGVVLREGEMFSPVVADVPGLPSTTVAESTRGEVLLLMSDGAVRCRTALERPVVPLVLRGTPLSVLFDLVMQDAEASSRFQPGLVGGTVVLAGASRPGGERISQQLELRVDVGDTLESALNRLVSTGTRLGWGVIEHDDQSASPCQIVIFTEDSVLWTPYDALLPAAPLPEMPR